MSWSECATASDFVQRRRNELLAYESRHCLAWGAVNRCQSAPKKVAITRFLTYTTGSINSAHALLTDHDQHLILSAMTDSEAGQLRDDLRRRQTTLLTIEGPAERAAQFVADWIEERGVKVRTRMNQGLYEAAHRLRHAIGRRRHGLRNGGPPRAHRTPHAGLYRLHR